ncbi:MAG: hypothetical protein IJM44_00200 [Ruminococcus sp.]|nr:hypothetical protein [Ruminococcus sp.]
MTPQLRNLLILLAGIVIALIIVILLFSGKSSFMRFMSIFLEDQDKADGGRVNSRRGRESSSDDQQQKKTWEPIVEMATLIRKTDDRQRIIESTGQERLVDEFYELTFVTRKGQKLRIECSRDAYDRIPFNQQGSLTYRRNVLVKFKYYEDTIFNN